MMKKILIVEDETSIREMLTLIISQHGYEPLEAASYAEAQQHLAEPFPSLILLDWMLPDLSGIKIAKQLKQNESSKHIPIIMLTARSEEDDKIRGLEVGADDYVTKPSPPRN